MEKSTRSTAIGMHLGKTIYKIIENNGHQYVFDRLAECDLDGCPLQQLSKDELMLKSGLIYRQA